tara:strand:- start:2570 stop:2770 length:201 start_codon:yes stop_codon:yes gene_type:complete
MERTFIDNPKNDDLKKSALTSRMKRKNTKVIKSTMVVNNALTREMPERSLSEQLMEVVIREFEKIK